MSPEGKGGLHGGLPPGGGGLPLAGFASRGLPS